MPLDLVQVVAEKTDALYLLEAAYQVRSEADGERAIALDGMLDLVRDQGFLGHADLAAGVLRRSGKYLVRKGVEGRWAVLRQAGTALANVPIHSTALVPIAPQPEAATLIPIGRPRFVIGRKAPNPIRRAA